MKILAGMIFCCFLLTEAAFGAEPMSTQPFDNPVPGEFGAGGQRLTGGLPPSFPAYLPNGAVNLDEAWIEDGGARYYWNLVIVPRQLKMGGAYWVDPALVPILIPQTTQKAVRRNYSRVVRPKVAKVAKAPARAGSTALRAPAIPLPVDPVPAKTARVPAPFSPAQNRTAVTAPVDTTQPVEPPRLQ